jgi:hypothetical protein
LNNPEKNYCQAPQAATPDRDHLKDASAVIARRQSGDKGTRKLVLYSIDHSISIKSKRIESSKM